MTEYFDVVDEKDRPTGQKVTKTEAHQQNIPHRVATVLVFRPNGNILIQAHKFHGRLLDHSVGGHLEAGEDYETAAKREMKEELGLEVPIEKVAEGVLSEESYPNWGVQTTHLFGIFTARTTEHWKLVETEEVDQLLEMQVEEVVKAMNTSPDKFLQGFMTTLGAYLHSIESPLKIKAYGKTWGEL